jgi:hypothetical protein
VSGAVATGRLTKEQAHELGLVPEGTVWDEESQTTMPLGMKIALDRFRKEADADWLLEQYDRQRNALDFFVSQRMKEAEYDKDGWPRPGKLGDYYMLPGYEKRALSKPGAEKLATFFRLRILQSRITHSIETPEYVSARVGVDLVDAHGRGAGSFEGAATSDELGFQTPAVRQKYGAIGEWVKVDGENLWKESKAPNYRAGLHDIASRARKRGFTGAVITAVGAHEVFDVMASTTPAGEAGLPEEDDRRLRTSKKPINGAARPLGPDAARGKDAVPGGLTHMPIGPNAGQPIVNIYDDELEALAKSCAANPETAAMAKQFEAVLAARKLAGTDGV